MMDCTAGQTTMPTECDRHASHHWCGVCEGFYGVPHTGMHEGLDAHPRDLHSAQQCACRPCNRYGSTTAEGREVALGIARQFRNGDLSINDAVDQMATHVPLPFTDRTRLLGELVDELNLEDIR
jgi:hypothetical protein